MKRSVGIVLLIWVLIADVACAGDYKVIGGAFVEICEAYLKNLNAFPGAPLVVCERPLHQKFPEFSKPQWERLDILQHLDLLQLVERKVYPAFSEEEFEPRKFEARTKRMLREREFTLSMARLDVDGDGIPERVVRYQTAGCSPTDITTHYPSGVWFVVMQEEGLRLDDEKTRRVNTTIGRPEMFLYKGQVFMDAWGGYIGGDERYGQLRVYDVTSSTGGVPCQYKYAKADLRRKTR